MDSSSPRSETAGGRTGFVVAALVVGLVVLLGAVLATKSIFGSDEPSSPPATAAGHDTPEPAATDGSVCGLDDVDKSGSLTQAPSAKWDLVHTMALPSSKKAGPGKIEEGLRYCYSRTPEGAVLMALNMWGWSSDLDQELILERQIASGPGYEAAQKEIRNSPKSPTPADDFTYQIRGFQVLHYDGDTALIDTAVQTEDGTYFHMRAELVWEKGDWRLRTLPDGKMPEFAQLPDLTGFVSFYGV